MSVVIGITGASGAIYGIRLLEVIKGKKYLIISENGKKVIKHETRYSVEEIKKLAHSYYENDNLSADVSSGSFKFDFMVIVPCSMNTLSKIALGIEDNLITRVASVCIKENRKLIIVPREMPVSQIHLENMARLAQSRVTILPAMPAFYHKPKNVEDIVNFVVGRILDAMGIEHKLYRRWGRDL